MAVEMKRKEASMLGRLLCRIGIHWMSGHASLFVDKVSGETVYNATCPCGKEWMVDTPFPLAFSKIERKK